VNEWQLLSQRFNQSNVPTFGDSCSVVMASSERQEGWGRTGGLRAKKYEKMALGHSGKVLADTAGAIKIPKIATWKTCLPKARLFQRLLFAERGRVVLSAALADLVEVQF
jgi:hypothetical protein